MTDTRLRVGTRLVVTIPQAAAHYGLTLGAMRQALRRLPDVRPVDPPPVDERTPVYYLAELDRAMRPGGPGRPGRGRRRRPVHASGPSVSGGSS